MTRESFESVPLTTTAVLTIAEIRSAAAAFDAGETNLFEALDRILEAAEAYQAAALREGKRRRPRRRAA